MALPKDPIIKSICKDMDANIKTLLLLKDNNVTRIESYILTPEANNRFTFRIWNNKPLDGKDIVRLLMTYFDKSDMTIYSVANITSNGYLRVSIVIR